MDQPLVDRRLDVRFGQPAIAGTQAILRPGYSVSLIDLSAGGALIEGPRPLRPGSRVHLQLTTKSRRLGIIAHVLRCSVASLGSGQGIQYRGALKFDQRCDVIWESGTLDGYLFPDEHQALTHSNGQGLPGPHSSPDDRTGREHK
jgi:PilZ domain